MTNSKSLAAGLLFCVFALPAAQAQTMIDVSKITCEQFLLYKITNPNNIALWISGYYNGKRDNTVLDVQGLQEHVEKVKDYCVKNYNVTVMQAVETLFAGKK
jgi:hypothetical protein